MRYFLDTEFYENGSTIDLISIGMVAEDGRELYACSLEAQLDRIHADVGSAAWMRENVLKHLPNYGDPTWMGRGAICARIEEFLRIDLTKDEKPEIWGYYSSYDWVAFCQLWRTMLQLPKGFPKFCLDLKQYAVMLDPKLRLPPKPKDAHNALADARWNRDLHAFLAKEEEALRIRTGRVGRAPREELT